MKLELTVRYISERRRFDDFAISSSVPVGESVEIARDNGFAGTHLTIQGNSDPEEMEPGFGYRLFGQFTSYKNKFADKTERQFKFTSFIPVPVHDQEGIVAYLASVGAGNGMGHGTAKACWRKWGQDAVEVIRKDPRQLFAVSYRITEQQCDAIGAKLKHNQAIESATIDITSLLNGRGFPKRLPRKCVKAWGNLAATIIRKDPYRLMQFPGCGFNRCDALYLELGLPRTSLRRQALCAWHAISSDSEGDTWFPVQKAYTAIKQAAGNEARPERAIELATRLGKLSPGHYGALSTVTTDSDGQLSDYGDRLWIAEARKARQELELAEMTARAIVEDAPRRITEWETLERKELSVADHVRCNRCGRRLTAPSVHVLGGVPFGPTCIDKAVAQSGSMVEPEVVPIGEWLQSHAEVKRILETQPRRLAKVVPYSLWPDPSTLEVTDHQREHISNALVSRVGILGGAPGTGKTFCVAQVVKALLKSGLQYDDIAIGAPTGKAAVRVTENLSANHISLRARTWHSLLGVSVSSGEGNGFSFLHNEQNPWHYKVIIGDESSMNDVPLMNAIFSARPRGCHALLVGDVNQLPPVGFGAPFRDLINKLPYGELTEIMRNSGGIVEACAAIRDERDWSEGDNLHILAETSPEAQMAKLEPLLDKCRSFGLDPVWDCQLLTAVNLRSPLSRKMCNQHLQQLLNSNEKINGTPFRIDDKIVCTKNGYYSLNQYSNVGEVLADDDGRVAVANGEFARILEIQGNKMIARLNSPDREIVIPLGKTNDESSDDPEKSSGTGCNFDLAYALSVHKSQGSQWPVAIVILDSYPGARRICDRSWIYTAISRACEKCYLIGQKSTADAMCRRNNIRKRKTFLSERIGLQQVNRILECI